MSDGGSRGSSLVQLLKEPLFHGVYVVLLAGFGLTVDSYPAVATYGLYFLSLISLLLLGALWRRRRSDRLAGTFYREGENQALTDIKRDIEALPPNSRVTVCGTGVTAIQKLVPVVYEALKRGVHFYVFMLHPCDEITPRLAEVEPDFATGVLDPLRNDLMTVEEVRQYLDPDWCDAAAALLAKERVCHRHGDREHDRCALHPRVICSSADMWKRVQTRLDRTVPNQPHGSLTVRGYHLPPLIKAWRFEQPDDARWYYVADQVYHEGVGKNNPMRRVAVSDSRQAGERTSPEDLMIPDFKRLDEHLEALAGKSDPL